jgi:hypothetical protein
MMAQMIDNQNLGKITVAKDKKICDDIIQGEIEHIKDRYDKHFKDATCNHRGKKAVSLSQTFGGDSVNHPMGLRKYYL